jgi:hypothetical protein
VWPPPSFIVSLIYWMLVFGTNVNEKLRDTGVRYTDVSDVRHLFDARSYNEVPWSSAVSSDFEVIVYFSYFLTLKTGNNIRKKRKTRSGIPKINWARVCTRGRGVKGSRRQIQQWIVSDGPSDVC